MMIGRVEKTSVDVAIGYPRLGLLSACVTALLPRLRLLEVLYRGMPGDWSKPRLNALLLEIKEGLARGECHAVRFRMLGLHSSLWQESREKFSWASRGCVGTPNPHWSLDCSKGYKDYFQGLDTKTRKNFTRRRKQLEAEFGDATVRHLDQPQDAESVAAATEAIVAKTYQKGFDRAWTSAEMLARVRLWLARGVFHAYFLSLDGEVCAYQHVLNYGGEGFGIGTGYDPRFQRYAIGRFIQLRAIEDLCERHGVRSIDFGFGDADYKRELCGQRWEEADLVLFRPSAVGLAGNLLRTNQIKVIEGGKLALKALGLFQHAKRIWRQLRRARLVAGIEGGIAPEQTPIVSDRKAEPKKPVEA
jgi:hypothetical protein